MPKSKVLVTGAHGQFGTKVAEVLKPDFDLILTDRDNLDITDPKKVEKFILKSRPGFVVHLAAYTAVDRAEDEKDVCHKINVEGSVNIATAAKKAGSVLIAVSTDYVFDGSKKSPYLETDQANPQSVYAKTKLAGEEAVRKLCPQSFIIRTSWLFGEVPGQKANNFVEKMLELGEKNRQVKVVDDQIGSPTYTGDLAEVIKKVLLISLLTPHAPHPTPHALRPTPYALPYGIYHFSGRGQTSWCRFAKEVFKQADLEASAWPISSSEFPQKAKRPPYSYLDCNKIEKLFGTKIRPWQEMLATYLKERN